ncbi:MAG: hypothetical protein ACR2F5_00275 [Candidatus Limnocylindria bacterium]
MRRYSPLLRLLASLAIVIGVSVLPVAQVAACSCMQMAPAEAAEMAEVVFSGTVAGEEPVAQRDRLGPAMGNVVYTFAVDGVAKGEIDAQVRVLSGGDGASCGMTFAMDERWLIFATADGGQLGTGLCSGNVPLAADEAAPITMTAPTATDPADGGAGLPVGIILPAAVVLSLVGISALLFWRADRVSARGGPAK